MKHISILIPCRNEEMNVPHCYTALKKVLLPLSYSHEILFVDDHSSDGTWTQIENLCKRDTTVIGLKLKTHLGQQRAIGEGLIRTKGDAVITMDVDLQDPPELIPSLLEEWEKGYKTVYTTRKSQAGNPFYLLCSQVFYFALRQFSRGRYSIHQGDYALIDRSVVNQLTAIQTSYPYWRGMRSRLGANETSVSYIRPPRLCGKSSYSLGGRFNLALSAFYWSVASLNKGFRK